MGDQVGILQIGLDEDDHSGGGKGWSESTCTGEPTGLADGGYRVRDGKDNWGAWNLGSVKGAFLVPEVGRHWEGKVSDGSQAFC